MEKWKTYGPMAQRALRRFEQGKGIDQDDIYFIGPWKAPEKVYTEKEMESAKQAAYDEGWAACEEMNNA